MRNTCPSMQAVPGFVRSLRHKARALCLPQRLPRPRFACRGVQSVQPAPFGLLHARCTDCFF